MKLHTLALAAGLVMSGGAHAVNLLNDNTATPHDLGDFGAQMSWSDNFQVSQAAAIAHNLTFTITENLYAGSGVANIPLNWDFGGGLTVTFTDITDLAATIYNSSDNVHESFTVATPGYLTLPASTYFAIGDYTLKITGNATGTGNPAGMYVIAAVTAPIPEPETWGMLLAGVGLIGLRMRQRIRASRQVAIN